MCAHKRRKETALTIFFQSQPTRSPTNSTSCCAMRACTPSAIPSQYFVPVGASDYIDWAAAVGVGTVPPAPAHIQPAAVATILRIANTALHSFPAARPEPLRILNH